MSLGARVDAIFSPDGPLAQTLAAFEPREGQRRMAAAVADTLEDGGVLLVEAGTGTGKTLAYLVPAFLSGQRVIVSTGTKNLQEQIFTKDLPLLARVLPVSFTATCMKGRGNYLCLHRFESFSEGAKAGTLHLFGESAPQIFLPIIEEWSKRVPAPARRSPISSPQSSAASVSWCRPARRTSRNRSTSRTSPRSGKRLASISPPRT